MAELERRIGHRFADRELLERALTHASAGDGARTVRHNERLEFLGDRVLNLIIAERLIERMGDAREGDMSRVFHQLVNYHACATAARAAGVPDALQLGGGAAKVGIRTSDRVLGDACEALIAALYIDGGMEAARGFVSLFWAEVFDALDTDATDPKTRLQQWALSRQLPLPDYRLVSQTGPAHLPTFVIAVVVQGLDPETASGGNKQDAQRLAAERLLSRLDALT